jgi:type III secretory pathway component EscS
MKRFHAFVASIAILAVSATTYPQLKQVIKLVGVGAAVKQFGPQLNSSINKLTSHTDSDTVATKVVPIVSAGISSRQAIGAAQVMGPKTEVSRVQAVAQLDQDVFGKEVKIRAMIPIASMDPTKLSRVEGVGVSGIVDLKL